MSSVLARRNDKVAAIHMRQKGMSYSEIRKELNVSKGTLSAWLSGIELTTEQIAALKNIPQRIERYRETVQKRNKARLEAVYEKAKKDIGDFSQKELLLAGLMLYWGEGTKALPAHVALTNTNPGMLKFFLKWLDLFNVDKSKIKVRLHLYSDMDIDTTMLYWSKELSLPLAQFRKPYIKKTESSSITYRNSFKMGTCSVTYGSAPLYEYIMMCIKVLENSATRP
ncbi:MAG: hypothetical protein JWL92_675 [Candidatus Nomurabacteria bacterium]|nr:hypothetical protein [Candidatus Nomurabacteria bacterium]